MLKDNKYRRFGRKLEADWCDIMDGKSNSYLARFFIDMIKKTIPQYVHKCPYIGTFVIENFPVPRGYTIMSEVGRQRKQWTVSNGTHVIGLYEDIIDYY